jgi:hypothetical protein
MLFRPGPDPPQTSGSLNMKPSSLPAFDYFPKEGAIIGRLLAGYTKLDLMNCVQIVRDDFDTVMKAMFRSRGEQARISVADAFGRQHYHKYRLGTQFEQSISCMKYCLKIRNQ